ncbi:TRAP transporter small permease [Calderihabitans maritimus]|uniref:Tripartite AtP-independent periplasmic transporter subunit DctQ n=1 Tax=Calderihabitans maritimus TaxID=1246530 RepID=A0A1Z5HW66_9FIRM|nr:TRAP transporter small permease [Calderihabitans maritimus]GAW93783.1 tripartite AtP-independent periplasmic transporter subunit DctQ [Calderihabitans maritimus]
MQQKEPPKFLYWLDKFEEGAVTILLGAMTVVVFLQVFFRFVIKGSLPWSEELARYLMVWAVFIGASIGAKEGAHIGVEAFVAFLPAKLRRVALVLAGAFSLLFCIIIAYLSFKVVGFLMKSGQLSPAMQIPIFWAYLAIPVGSILMAIRFVQATAAKLRNEGVV